MRISVLDQSPLVSGGTPADALRNTIDLARHADRLGYHRYWVAGHHSMVSHGSPAPEILVGRLAMETSGIRVGSGGVLLSLYQPLKVAEVFRTLHVLYPDRVDLGIGRSPGGLPLAAKALGQQRLPTEAEFQAKLGDLLGFLLGFPPEHEFADVDVMPSSPGAPPVWLLGSSTQSALMAAANGLPYSYAHFINPGGTVEAITAYRSSFRPSVYASSPQVILGIGVYCAETSAEAQRIFATQRLFRRWAVENHLSRLPSPAEALEALTTGADPLADEHFPWPRYAVGAPDEVHAQISAMASSLEVDEVIAMASIHDHKARVRSYELLAEVFRLPAMKF
ncbi:LLM class flavin-dependent oxidoreductase [Actinocrispum sp. NPDC049592]|uniref:LLM class flavin-dependent oxidoreductase n=1 Tax=Actinocrispum sp. NPDC049592 TaxID=3154835 RepID=UPI003447141B